MNNLFPPYAIFSTLAILAKFGMIWRYWSHWRSYSNWFKLCFASFFWLNIVELVSFYYPTADKTAYLLLTSYYACAFVGVGMIAGMSLLAAGQMRQEICFLIVAATGIGVLLSVIPGLILDGVNHIGFTITRIPGKYYWVFQVLLLFFVALSFSALLYACLASPDIRRRRNSKALLFSLLPIFVVVPTVLLLMQMAVPVTGTVFGSFAILFFLMTLAVTETQIVKTPASDLDDNRLFKFLSNIPVTSEFKLANRVRRAVASKYSNNLEKAVTHYEETLIQETLKLCEGNKSLAAKMLGISRTTLRRKIQAVDQRRLRESAGTEAPACDTPD